MSSSEEVARKLDALWQSYLPTMRSRLAAIQVAIESLEAGHLDGETRQKAGYEAHKLAGSLGTFGLASSSRMSSEIEHILSEPATESEAAELKKLFECIKRDVESRQILSGL